MFSSRSRAGARILVAWSCMRLVSRVFAATLLVGSSLASAQFYLEVGPPSEEQVCRNSMFNRNKYDLERIHELCEQEVADPRFRGSSWCGMLVEFERCCQKFKIDSSICSRLQEERTAREQANLEVARRQAEREQEAKRELERQRAQWQERRAREQQRIIAERNARDRALQDEIAERKRLMEEKYRRDYDWARREHEQCVQSGKKCPEFKWSKEPPGRCPPPRPKRDKFSSYACRA